jgi:hypothetical protein
MLFLNKIKLYLNISKSVRDSNISSMKPGYLQMHEGNSNYRQIPVCD